MWKLHLAPNIIYKKWTQFNLISFLCIIQSSFCGLFEIKLLDVCEIKLLDVCVCVGWGGVGGGVDGVGCHPDPTINLVDLDIWSDIYNDMHHQ